jgi:DNA-binding response OmpR family regulator
VAHTILVVDVDLDALDAMSAVLADGGYLVARASSFAEARQKLAVLKPDALVTAIRLGGFNGLHLVIRGRSTFPDIVAIVTHPGADPALQADAAAHQAVWMMNPIDADLLREMLARMLRSQRTRPSLTTPRRWERRRVADQVGATLGVLQGTVVDVSYGGLRLRLNEPLSDASRDPQPLALPALGLALKARPVWGRGAGPAGPWWYGVELDEADASENQPWRAFVDAAGDQVSH